MNKGWLIKLFEHNFFFKFSMIHRFLKGTKYLSILLISVMNILQTLKLQSIWFKQQEPVFPK